MLLFGKVLYLLSLPEALLIFLIVLPTCLGRAVTTFVLKLLAEEVIMNKFGKYIIYGLLGVVGLVIIIIIIVFLIVFLCG